MMRCACGHEFEPEVRYKHRLLCADSTDPDARVLALGGETPAMIWSDPPYGLGGYAGRGGHLDAVDGDADPHERILEYFKVGQAAEVYICCNFESYPTLLEARDKPRSLIVWVKPTFGMGSGYRRQHEFIGYYGAFDGTTETDVWEINRETAPYIHPTQKPAALPGRAIGNSTHMGEIVFDPFGGSGPCMEAAEHLHRRSCLIEKQPKYCACILERMTALGLTPEVIP